jgi:hypothetical protein
MLRDNDLPGAVSATTDRREAITAPISWSS